MPRGALAGAIVWLALVLSRPAGLTRLTLVDVLFLLAPLVIVPLGLSLLDFEQGPAAILLSAARWGQPAGAALAAAAFLVPTGVLGALLALAWLLVCGIAALGALAFLAAGRSLRLSRLAAAAAAGFMAFGAVWLVLSRAGIAPLGLSPVVVELTALHFHFTGFAATLLAGLVLRRLDRESGPWRRLARTACLLMIVGSPVLAAGWGTPLHALQVAGAILVAAGVIATAAGLFFPCSTLVDTAAARALLRLAALAPLLPMVLAVEYSAGQLFGFPTLDIRGMALIHGQLNALGFSLLGLLGFSIGRPLRAEPARPS